LVLVTNRTAGTRIKIAVETNQKRNLNLGETSIFNPYKARMTTGADDFTTSVGQRFEALGKISVAIAALSYAVGILIVNSDLANYHVALFSLARPQYVLVGAAWLVISTAVALPPTLTAIYCKRFRTRLTKGVFIAIGLCVSIYLAQLFVPHSPLGVWFVVITIALLESWIFAMVYGFVTDYREAKSYELSKPGTSRMTILQSWLLLAVGSLLPLGSWVRVYTGFVFPYMAQNLGGGKHPVGTVVFRQPDKGDSAQLQEALSPIPLVGLSTKEKVIIVSVDTDFVVLVSEDHKQKPVLVSKSLIASIRYD
jgi:hypothetical protein